MANGKYMKRNKLIIFIFLLIFLASALPSFALTPTTKAIQKIQERETVKASRAAVQEDAQLTKIKERAGKMIENRLTSLNNILTRIQSDRKLTSEDKTSLTQQVNDMITKLNALKTKISADTDVETAKTDTKSIVNDYRVFAMFEPKIRLLIVISDLQNLSLKMSAVMTRLQAFVSEQKSKGQDVTTLQTSLDDITARLKTIDTKLADDKTKISNVTATDYKTVFVTVRQDLASVRAEFAKIRNDIAQIRNSLKKLFKSSLTPTVTTTP